MSAMRRSGPIVRAPQIQRVFFFGLLFAVLIEVSASAQSDLIGQWPEPAAPPGNPFDPTSIGTQDAIRLGAMLFWDEQLSSDDTMACGTCHSFDAGGAEQRDPGLHPGSGNLGSFGMLPQDATNRYTLDALFGVDRRVTEFSSPSVVGAAFFERLFWDRRAGPAFEDESGASLPDFEQFAALEAQASIPPIGPTEMAHDGIDWDAVAAKLAGAQPLRIASSIPPALAALITPTTTYDDLFLAVFGSPPPGEDTVSRERVSMALSTYQRSLVPDQSAFDLGLMSAAQRNGFVLFTTAPTKSQFARTCSACHSASLFDGFATDQGVLVDSNDNLFSDGLRHQIGLPDNAIPLKTPSLRNVGLRKHFMHSGEFASLDEVLDFYNTSTDAKFGFDPPLSGSDLADLKDFLENALTDPRVANRTGPFEHPTLRSETVPFGSNHYESGEGHPGHEPVMLANAPPFLGNGLFKLGIGGSLAGAVSRIGISPNRVPTEDYWAGIPFWIDISTTTWRGFTLSENGTATHFAPVPDDIALFGTTFYAQWVVVDPTLGGVTTDPAEFIRF